MTKTTITFELTASSKDENFTINAPDFDSALSFELFFSPVVAEWRFNATHPKFGPSGKIENFRLRAGGSMFEVFSEILGYRLIFNTISGQELYTQDTSVSKGVRFTLEDWRE